MTPVSKFMTSSIHSLKLKVSIIFEFEYNHSTALIRFQLTTLILNFYSNAENKSIWHEAFIFIFCKTSAPFIDLLHNLVSSALHLGNENLLDAAAYWMEVNDLKSNSFD